MPPLGTMQVPASAHRPLITDRIPTRAHPRYMQKAVPESQGLQISSVHESLLQRKSPCVCGGGCPRCHSALPDQTRLPMSLPDDPSEREADHVAEQVMRMPKPQASAPPVMAERADRSALLHDLGPGTPLDPTTRAYFEPRFRQDFSNVRVHADNRAGEAASMANALAYTVGHEIVFGAGRYKPETEKGRTLLAHELTHVAQRGRKERDAIRRKDRDDPESEEPSPDVYSLMKAAEAGDYRTLEKLLKGGFLRKGLDPNSTDESGWTPLLFAADAGHPDAVALLVEKGANIEVLTPRDDEGSFPLKAAASGGHAEVVEVLLKKGASMFSKDRAGLTAPIWAARAGKIEAMETFLRHGLDVNYQDDSGMSLLMHAAQACQLEMVKWLIAHGADTALSGPDGRDVLQWAEAARQASEWEGGNISSRVIPRGENQELEKQEQEQALQKAMEKTRDCEAVIAYLRSLLQPDAVPEAAPPGGGAST